MEIELYRVSTPDVNVYWAGRYSWILYLLLWIWKKETVTY